jgi:hypothetical protein
VSHHTKKMDYNFAKPSWIDAALSFGKSPPFSIAEGLEGFAMNKSPDCLYTCSER